MPCNERQMNELTNAGARAGSSTGAGAGVAPPLQASTFGATSSVRSERNACQLIGKAPRLSVKAAG